MTSARAHDFTRASILACLQRGKATSGIMAASAGVTVRTIYRHIKALQAQGVPIRGERGVGYVLRRKGGCNGD